MYTHPDSVDDIKNSLSDIELLLQRGTELLYGDQEASAPPPSQEQPSRSHLRGPQPTAARAAAAPAAPSRQGPTLRARSASRSIWAEEERHHQEVERFFEEDAKRILKIKKDERKMRIAEAKKAAAAESSGVGRPPRRGAAAAPKEPEVPPEQVNLEEIRSRIHKEVAQYKASCQARAAAEAGSGQAWSTRPPTARKSSYVSPYAASKTTASTSSSPLWRKPAVPTQQKGPSRPTPASSAARTRPTAGTRPSAAAPARAPFRTTSQAAAAPPPAPPRRPRAPVDSSIPIWERLYSDGASKRQQRTASAEPERPPPKPKPKPGTKPKPGAPGAASSTTQQKRAAAAKGVSPPATDPYSSDPFAATTVYPSSDPFAESPSDGMPQPLHERQRSDSPMNAPNQLHNYSSYPEEEELNSTVPFISPLDLSNLHRRR